MRCGTTSRIIPATGGASAGNEPRRVVPGRSCWSASWVRVSSVGRELAGIFGLEFVDVDARIEPEAGSTIRDLFPREGEPAFREREKEALREVLAGKGA